MLQQQQHLDVNGSVHSINELHPERRISFSTVDDENSPRESHDLIGEEQHQQLIQQQFLEKTGKGKKLFFEINIIIFIIHIIIIFS
jgi:hypothetical protein